MPATRQMELATAPPLQCLRCGFVIETPPGGAERFLICHRCGEPVALRLFPAFYRTGENRQATIAAAAGDAPCFHHPERQASSVCQTCGRFLCGLCHIDFSGRSLCAACLQREYAEARRSGTGFDGQRIRYDQLALYSVILSPVVWYASFLTAALALYLTFRYWRRPLSLVPCRRWRFVAASVLGAGILVTWVVLAVILVMR